MSKEANNFLILLKRAIWTRATPANLILLYFYLPCYICNPVFIFPYPGHFFYRKGSNEKVIWFYFLLFISISFSAPKTLRYTGFHSMHSMGLSDRGLTPNLDKGLNGKVFQPYPQTAFPSKHFQIIFSINNRHVSRSSWNHCQ